MLSYAVDKNYIKNEGFKRWHEITWQKARYRHEIEKLEEMRAQGLSEIVIDDSDIEIKEMDKNCDYINILKESIPKLRNHYAHGSTTLHNQVLGSIQIVSEIINQIYE